MEEAEKAEEERIFNEFPHVMMVGPNEEVRQRAADRVHDERRRQLDAIERGEGGGGEVTIKEEVVEEQEKEEEEEEGLHERRQELDTPQQGDKVGVGETNTSIKEEAEEEMYASNPLGNLLAEGHAVAIPTDLLQELDVKEEEQYEEGRLAVSGDVGEGEGMEQEPILLDGEEDEAVAEKELVAEDERSQVIAGDEGEAAGGDVVLRRQEVVNSGNDEEMHLDEDIAAEDEENQVNTLFLKFVTS